MNGAPCAFLVHPTVKYSMRDASKKRGSALGRHLQSRLTSGLVIFIPIAITLFVLHATIRLLTSFVLPWLRNLPFNIPDAALVAVALTVMAISVYITGLVAAHFFGRRLIRWGDRLLLRLPIVKPVYSASRQVVSIFASPSRTAFHAVALAEFPRKDSFSVGFITGTMIDPEGVPMYCIFIPTTPNPTTGFIIMQPEDETIVTDLSVEEGVKMIISGGMLSPHSYRTRTLPPIKRKTKNAQRPTPNSEG